MRPSLPFIFRTSLNSTKSSKRNFFALTFSSKFWQSQALTKDLLEILYVLLGYWKNRWWDLMSLFMPILGHGMWKKKTKRNWDLKKNETNLIKKKAKQMKFRTFERVIFDAQLPAKYKRRREEIKKLRKLRTIVVGKGAKKWEKRANYLWSRHFCRDFKTSLSIISVWNYYWDTIDFF